MASSSLLLIIGTSALALLLVGLVPWAVHVAGKQLGEKAWEIKRARQIGVQWAAFVLAISGSMAAMGVFRDFSAVPPPFALLLFPVTSLTLFMAFSSFGARLVRGLPLWALVGFQVFRLPVELILLGLYQEGRLPKRMTFEGYNFDIVTALTALVVAYLLYKGKAGKGLVLAWNVMGLGLVLTIISIGILSTPTFTVFQEGPANRIMAEFPFVWVPVIFVQAAIFGHILVFRALRLSARYKK
jgi:hypothetical protein